MDLLTKYHAIQSAIFDCFGYVEDWRILPIVDSTEHFWRLYGKGPGDFVRFAESAFALDDADENYYQHEIYTNRHLPRWVYRGNDYTMVCVDTRCDGNQFLQVFDNSKERQ